MEAGAYAKLAEYGWTFSNEGREAVCKSSQRRRERIRVIKVKNESQEASRSNQIQSKRRWRGDCEGQIEIAIDADSAEES